MDWWLGDDLGAGGSLSWGSEPWVIVGAVALAIVSLLLVYRREGGSKGVELLCWWLAVSVLVWGISDPRWNEDAGRTEPGRSVVLVDDSRSMSVAENGRPRHKEVLAMNLQRITITLN